MLRYRGANPFDEKPHIFSIAEAALQDLRYNQRDQCVIVSGESGAGKTESSKILLRYIAAGLAHQKKLVDIQNQLLLTNHIMEAFGNAKTIRNDNSSRFGKYMDVQLNGQEEPIGGEISTYLLEKSRVVHISKGERNFHIFYMLLSGLNPTQLNSLFLESDPTKYEMLSKSGCFEAGRDDKQEMEYMIRAMDSLSFSQKTQESIFKCVAAVLLLGNLVFGKQEGQTGQDKASCVTNMDVVTQLASLLSVDSDQLCKSLTNRSIRDSAKKSKILVPLDVQESAYSRDAIAKCLYERLFFKVISQINEKLNANKSKSKSFKIGVLDIYGFEIFEKNSFEQLVINYSNEKLQQLFINLTLKAEQDDYSREEIAWEGVQYFNNQPICEMIEAKNVGLLSLLNEETTRPGEPTDLTLLEKLDTHLSKNQHYDSYCKTKNDKRLVMAVFMIRHYAGDVIYEVDGFLKKNKDELHKDVLYCLNASADPFVKSIFPETDSGDAIAKRPDTLATQLKNSMVGLMTDLSKKNPHYIRCIRPNHNKVPKQFDLEYVTSQWRYLGLLENIHVKRAGFCFRKEYHLFLRGFGMLCPKTWPNYPGTPREGVQMLMEHLKIPEEEYKFGKTMVFVRKPTIVMQLEKLKIEIKYRLAIKIQAVWRGHLAKKQYKRIRSKCIIIQAWYKMVKNQQKYLLQRKCALTITRVFRGHLARKKFKKLLAKLPRYASVAIQRSVRRYFARKMIRNIKHDVKRADGRWATIKWPKAPSKLTTASDMLLLFYRRIKALQFRRKLDIDDAMRQLYKFRILSRDLLGQKAAWKVSLKVPMTVDHIGGHDLKVKWPKLGIHERVDRAMPATKLNRHDPVTEQPRFIILTEKQVVVVDPKSWSIKEQIPLGDISEISVSKFRDGLIVLHCEHSKKGDLLLRNDELVVDFVTQLYQSVRAFREPKLSVQEM
ncbi:P-loop containing nucleoside triphosphate hydrolase protein [Gorgonomyces haynaldii]|nr:P-loop containing nucleoside triphosphate hydrolase protein [Gorgonomyces haynaldii]